MNVREITLTVTVTVPATVGECEVENAINSALDEKNGVDWGSWYVGAAIISRVKKRLATAEERDLFGENDDEN